MSIQRISRLKDKLMSRGVEGFICDSLSDLKYFSCGQVTSGKLVITSDNARLFVTPIDAAMYQDVQDIEVVVCNSYSDETFVSCLKGLKTCGFDPDAVSYESYRGVISHCSNPIPLKFFLEKIRSLKNPEEIELLKAAANLGSRGFDHVLAYIAEGVSAIDLAKELRTFWSAEGASGTAFPPIIAFGEDTAFPHASVRDRKLKPGEPVLVDIGVELNDYCSDMTRVVFFGSPHPILADIYSIVREAQLVGLSMCRPGVSCRSIHESVVEVIKASGYEKQFVHGTGHGIGMAVHEYPYLSFGKAMDQDVLETSMAVTVEPGIYLPGIGGVRLENTIIITSDGYLDLTERPILEGLPLIF